MGKYLKHKSFGTIALLTVAIIWGSGFIATEFLIAANWSTSQMMATRFTLASLIMLAVIGRKIKESSKKEIISGSIAGLILFAAFYSQTFGQSAGASVSFAAFFTATNVVMVPFISWAINGDKPSIKTILIAILALAGVAVLSIEGGSFSLGLGDLIILLGSFFFALHISFLEKAGGDTDALRVNFYQITTAAVLSIIVTLFDMQTLPGFDFKKGIWAAIYLGAFSTCLCYMLQTKAQQYVSASYAGVILALEGFFGSMFSVILGLEKLTMTLVIGGVMIILATVLMSFKSEPGDELDNDESEEIEPLIPEQTENDN